MSFNQIGRGKTLQIAIPAGGCSCNTPVLVGNDTIGVPENTYGAGTAGNVTLNITGVFRNLPLKTGDAPSVGDKLYWDNGNTYLTVTASSNALAGWCWELPVVGVTTTVGLKLKG